MSATSNSIDEFNSIEECISYYKEIINDDSIFMDLDRIIKRIMNGENSLLDTYNVKFINKGPPYISFLSFTASN